MNRRTLLFAMTLVAAASLAPARAVFAENQEPPPLPANQPEPGVRERSPRRPPPLKGQARPPQPRVEAGAQRPYFVWIPGRWQWRDGNFEWIPGVWSEGKPGWRWRPGRWTPEHDAWEFSDGRWVPIE